MKINKITIRNFRSIESAEISPNAFNVFVGQNNHGKTNLFEAIDWFFNGLRREDRIEDIRFGRKGNAKVEVEIEFSGAQEGVKRMKTATNRTKIEKLLEGNDNIIIKRTSEDIKNRKISVNGEWKETIPTGFDRTLNEFLPKFEYIDTKKYFEHVAKFGKTTPIGIMLSSVLTTILEKSDQYRQFHEKFNELFGGEKSDIKIELDKLSNRVKIYLEKQFPDCTKVQFEVSPPIFDDLLKNFDTTIDDGIETHASEKGDGMQRALMLAILQAYADFRRENEDIGKSFLFFIDEAELHLHPTAQRNLKNVLLEISNDGDQVFINTHSSVLVADEHDNQKIFKVEKIGGKTFIEPLKEVEKSYIVYDLLGGSPADLLLPRNFLIVEGRSEYEFLRRVIKRFYADKAPIHIVYAEGDHEKQKRSMEGINKTLIPLRPIYNDRLVILCDKPHKSKQADFDNFKRAYKSLVGNGQLFELEYNNIEEYYPNPWTKTAEEIDDIDKVSLAKEVGDNIEKEKFESGMPKVYEVLKKCWDLAY